MVNEALSDSPAGTLDYSMKQELDQVGEPGYCQWQVARGAGGAACRRCMHASSSCSCSEPT